MLYLEDDNDGEVILSSLTQLDHWADKNIFEA